MIIIISRVQIFTENEISIFEKVVHFLKNRIKNESTLNFFEKKTSESQTVGVKPWLT
jgi:hypothetical protein